MNKPQPHKNTVSPMIKFFAPIIFSLLSGQAQGQNDTIQQRVIVEALHKEKIGLDRSIPHCSRQYLLDIIMLQEFTIETHGDIFPMERLGLLMYKFERDYCEDGKLRDEYVGKRLRLHIDAVEREEGELEEVNSRLYFDDEM